MSKHGLKNASAFLHKLRIDKMEGNGESLSPACEKEKTFDNEEIPNSKYSPTKPTFHKHN